MSASNETSYNNKLALQKRSGVVWWSQQSFVVVTVSSALTEVVHPPGPGNKQCSWQRELVPVQVLSPNYM